MEKPENMVLTARYPGESGTVEATGGVVHPQPKAGPEMWALVAMTSFWMKDIRLSRVGLLWDWDKTVCLPKGWKLPLTNATCYVAPLLYCSSGSLNNILH